MEQSSLASASGLRKRQAGVVCAEDAEAGTRKMSGLDFNASKFSSYASKQGIFGGGARPMPSMPSFTKFSGGQSNFTYLVRCGRTAVVLRKQPSGALLSGAHQVDREAMIMDALAKAERGLIPLPRIFAIETDRSIIGTKFFVMEYVEGAIYRIPTLPEMSPSRRRSVYKNMARVLARIHSIDPRRVLPSAGGGKSITTRSFCERQIKIWGVQYEKAIVNNERETAMDELGMWLQKNIPEDEARRNRLCVLHGDFRIDNIIYDNRRGAEPAVKAVLDWELSSVGVATADLAYNCLGYYLPSVGFLKGFSLPQKAKLNDLGIPTVDEYVEMYRREFEAVSGSGAEHIPSVHSKEWCFYLCLGLYRIASISAGVYSRAVQGNASSGETALSFKAVVPLLADTGLGLIKDLGGGDEKSNDSNSREGEEFEGASEFCKGLLSRLRRFMEEEVLPAEQGLTDHAVNSTGVWPDRGERWIQQPIMTELLSKAKNSGLWNLWMTEHLVETLRSKHSHWPWERILPHGRGLSHSDYAYIAIETGRSLYGAEAINCMAPDTGNMEILALFGDDDQQQKWLLPLLLGETRSCFGMTEPSVASSDPTQLQSTAVKTQEGDWIINGRKWWTTGACDERCAVCIFVGTTAVSGPVHRRHSFFLVPMNAPGVQVVRPLTVFGYDDAPHGHAETAFDSVRLGADALLWKEGHGFTLAQNRLGPGRLHHCARLVGHSERALSETLKRGTQRKAFGKSLLDLGGNEERLAKSRVALNQAKLTVLSAAAELDLRDKNPGSKLRPKALEALAVCKIAAPRAAEECLDLAVQIHGGGGLSSDHPLAAMWAAARTLRLVDGPDEVHLRTLAKMERKRRDSEVHPGVGKPRL